MRGGEGEKGRGGEEKEGKGGKGGRQDRVIESASGSCCILLGNAAHDGPS